MNAVFETIGIAAIIPLINLIIQDDFLKNYEYWSSILLSISQLVLPSTIYESNTIKENLAIGGVISFTAVFFFKTIFFIFLTYIRITFTNSINYSISKKLYQGYLNLDYIFHTMRNSTNLKQNIITEISGFTATIGSYLIIITEVFILTSVITFLLIYNFFTSLIVFGFLFFISYIIFKLTRYKIASWGSDRLLNMEKRFKVLEEGLNSIQEIYIFQKSNYFIKNFSRYLQKFLNSSRNFIVIQNLARPTFELLGIISVMALILNLIFQGNDISQLIATLGLFMAASLRLLPSLNKIVSEMQHLKFNIASVERVTDELNTINKNNKILKIENRLNLEKSIIVDQVTFFYPGTDKPALKDISFTINKGSKFGIKGSSGSGKTTLINLILTLIKPSKGEIRVDETALKTNNISWLKNIGYVSQNINLLDDTIEKNIAFGLEKDQIDQEKMNKAIDDSQLKSFMNSLKNGINTRIGEKGLLISGGQRQRIGIARALYNDPKLIILDESTNSLDLKTEKILMDTVYNLGKEKTIIVVSHRDSALERCDKSIVISNGKIEGE